MVMTGADIFHYFHEEGDLQGVVLIHVDDLISARDAEFIEKIQLELRMI